MGCRYMFSSVMQTFMAAVKSTIQWTISRKLSARRNAAIFTAAFNISKTVRNVGFEINQDNIYFHVWHRFPSFLYITDYTNCE